MKFAVVTVTHRSIRETEAWAHGLASAIAAVESQGHCIRIIVVDNGSDDGTPNAIRAHAPDALVVELGHNLGFAAGCNRGLNHVADDEVALLLNPDVVITREFFDRASAIEWDDGLAAVGPRVSDSSTGEVEQSARSFPSASTGLFGRTTVLSRLFPRSRAVQDQLLARPEFGITTVDWVSGACLMAPRSRFRTVGLLDEGYWMYWEDADWCQRAAKLGLRVEYHPELGVIHRQGSSSATRPLRTTVAFHRSANRYYQLHVSRSSVSRAAAMIALSIRGGVKVLRAVAQARLPPGRGNRG